MRLQSSVTLLESNVPNVQPVEGFLTTHLSLNYPFSKNWYRNHVSQCVASLGQARLYVSLLVKHN